jgi:DtxR family transcriptional regulator, Mn-dependent transcriptional regulator
MRMREQSRRSTVAEPSHSAPKEFVPPRRGRAADADPPCADVSGREAGYLLALHELAAARTPPTQKRLAGSMGVSAPTALEMVRRLRRMGLVEPDRLELTPKGTSAALLLASRRHAAHLLTGEVLGYADAATNPEAARLAPSLSRELARKLLAVRPPRES